jgi:hypothetical protein
MQTTFTGFGPPARKEPKPNSRYIQEEAVRNVRGRQLIYLHQLREAQRRILEAKLKTLSSYPVFDTTIRGELM